MRMIKTCSIKLTKGLTNCPRNPCPFREWKKSKHHLDILTSKITLLALQVTILMEIHPIFHTKTLLTPGVLIIIRSLHQEKKFEDWSYDSITRSFRGNIAWTEATFYGEALWKYEFVFSPDFNRIESGSVTCYDTEDEIAAVQKFGTRSSLGLVYTLNRDS